MAALITASGMARSRTWCNVVVLTLIGASATPLYGETTHRDTTIAALPRLGTSRARSTSTGSRCSPTLDADVTYNSNVFALPKRVVQIRDVTRSPPDDAVFTINPRVVAELNRTAIDIKADLHAGFIRYASTPSENVNTFGFALDTVKKFGASQTLTADVSFDRSIRTAAIPKLISIAACRRR